MRARRWQAPVIHPWMVREGRIWDPVRQAYYPRGWPMPLVGAVVAGTYGWNVFTRMQPTWLAFVVLIVGAWLIAVTIVKVRWWAWKRRHPELPPEQWVAVEMRRRANEKREAARWN